MKAFTITSHERSEAKSYLDVFIDNSCQGTNYGKGRMRDCHDIQDK